jgi:putative oxidoreductase
MQCSINHESEVSLMQSVTQLVERVSLPFLRLSLALVFVWYGVLDFINPGSPLGLLHITVFSFLAFPAFVYTLATLNIVVGLLFALGLWLRYASLLAMLILIGPLVIFLTAPAITGFPQLTLAGEFFLKDLVLFAAALSVAAADIVRQKQLSKTKAAYSA